MWEAQEHQAQKSCMGFLYGDRFGEKVELDTSTAGVPRIILITDLLRSPGTVISDKSRCRVEAFKFNAILVDIFV